MIRFNTLLLNVSDSSMHLIVASYRKKCTKFLDASKNIFAQSNCLAQMCLHIL